MLFSVPFGMPLSGLPVEMPDEMFSMPFDMLLFVELSFVSPIRLYIVLLDVPSGMPFQVLSFFDPSVVLLVVSGRSTRRVFKTITLSQKRSKSATLVVSEGKPEPRRQSMLEGAFSLAKRASELYS